MSTETVTLCFTRQELWDTFIFGRISHQKFDNHVQDIVDNIVEKNNLKPVTLLSEILFVNDSVSIYNNNSLNF